METVEYQNIRLTKAFSHSDVNFLPDSYDYEEFDSEELNLKLNPEALALIRDGDRWSQLVKKESGAFVAFSIHFNGIDNVNGFVGWFASYLKVKLGIGLIVFVGSNSLKNGVYDYYGVPIEHIVAVKREVAMLASIV
ncbi:DUF6196 family protein [Pseudoalteromonas denitrificans]|jgi:hypothetical protein|uniref:Uncharacterized protein n=1 Tax=Pseudoalteromonas denitrificans DSM 6059 TaxID=1123010 RepID=A0A1I1PT35_9GAMM|nr:DUF6196 family protein [Pseudoalteromonas denitrificans]SFD12925.1 hypothetical protein SAMN02745724_03586 [Pseudoalteromonas denitrificans DSM 6059]